MFSSIAGIGEGFGAARVLAGVRLFPGVTAKVSLQILQSRVSLAASFKLQVER